MEEVEVHGSEMPELIGKLRKAYESGLKGVDLNHSLRLSVNERYRPIMEAYNLAGKAEAAEAERYFVIVILISLPFIIGTMIYAMVR